MVIEKIIVATLIIAFSVYIVSEIIAKCHRSQFKKIFGFMPVTRHDTHAIIISRQAAVIIVLQLLTRELAQLIEQRPTDERRLDALDMWEEEHDLALMRFEDAQWIAKRFGYYVQWEIH